MKHLPGFAALLVSLLLAIPAGAQQDPIAEKIRLELQAFVNEKSYTLVIDLADDSNVVWANASNDITKDVLVRVNESFKRSGGVAAPAPAPKAPATTAPATTTPPAGQRPPTATPAVPTPPAQK